MPEKKDRRGCPPGGGIIEAQPLPGARPGLIGNPPHVVTEELREKVRLFASVLNQEGVALRCGISADTLQRHYLEDYRSGKLEAVADVATGVLKRALEGSIPDSFYFLKTQGRDFGYANRMELTGAGGGPVQTVNIQALLIGKTDQELAFLEQFLTALLPPAGGAGEPGFDPARALAGPESAPPAQD